MPCIKIVAWAGWEGGNNINVRFLCEEANRIARTQGDEEIEIAFTQYFGGGQFIKEVAKGADIIIGDREIMSYYSQEGSLHSLSTKSQEKEAILSRYPAWLQRWSLDRLGSIAAIPVRWGTTAFLARKDFLESIARASGPPTANQLIGNAQDLLLWVPEGYFLPSMGLLATAVSPDSPFTLGEEQFKRFEAFLLRGLLNRSIWASHSLKDLAAKILEYSPQLIVCGGDWIWLSLEDSFYQECTPGVYEKLLREYTYVFAVDAKPLLFFEMAGILSKSIEKHASSIVLDVLSSRDFRKRVERLDVGMGGYVGNPTSEGASVIGPGTLDGKSYCVVRAETIATRGTTRWLPRNRFLQPQLQEWRKLFEVFHEDNNLDLWVKGKTTA